jgi:MoaA/NifB/PqqE/SkfB family radical SAM enzyme
MLPIESLLLDINRAIEKSAADPAHTPLVFDSTRLMETVLNGELRRKGNEFVYGITIPRFCIFSVTRQCNLHCKGCYARNNSGTGGLSLEAIGDAIQECSDLGVYMFVIAGGEPLMVPGLIETLAQEKRAFFFLFTNGTRLAEAHCRRIAKAGNIFPIISLEGDAADTDCRRGPGTAARIEQAMRRLSHAGIPFGFSAMLSHANVKTVTSRAWFDTMWNSGARFGYLIDYVPVPGTVDESLVLTDADRTHKREAISARSAEARPLIMNFPPDEYVTGECQAAGKGFIHINAAGYVEPCPFFHYAADSIREKPLEEILDSAFFRAVRAFASNTPNPRGECLLVKHHDEAARIAAQTGAQKTDGEASAIAQEDEMAVEEAALVM